MPKWVTTAIDHGRLKTSPPEKNPPIFEIVNYSSGSGGGEWRKRWMRRGARLWKFFGERRFWTEGRAIIFCSKILAATFQKWVGKDERICAALRTLPPLYNPRKMGIKGWFTLDRFWQKKTKQNEAMRKPTKAATCSVQLPVQRDLGFRAPFCHAWLSIASV